MIKPFIPVTISAVGGELKFRSSGFIDTGADVSIMDVFVATKLGLKPIEHTSMRNIKLEVEAYDVYEIMLQAAEGTPVRMKILASNTVGQLLGTAVIIGRDILRRCVLTEKGVESFEFHEQQQTSHFTYVPPETKPAAALEHK